MIIRRGANHYGDEDPSRTLGGVLRATLTAPGIPRVFVASLIGRLPMGAIALLLILRTREVTGSYAAGGIVAGANAVALGLFSPVLGRLIDRRGQSGVIAATGVVFALAMTGFAVLPHGAALGWAIGLAALAGASFPPLGPALRTLWTARIEDPGQRHAGFSLEAVIFEVVYIAGPLLFVSLIGAWSLAAAVAAMGVLVVLGAVSFASAPAARSWRPEDRGRDLLGALRSPSVRILIGVFLLFGIAVAAIEMGVVAFAETRDARGAIGPILACWGLGSMLGGLIAVRTGAPADPGYRMAQLFAGLAVVCLPLMLAGGVVSLGALILFSGLFIAPSLSLAFAIVGQVAPSGTVTEAYTWAATGIACGAGGGSALAGALVEAAGTTEAFGLAAAAAALAAGLLVARPVRVAAATA
jgi:predicted MFS family arabinose efflux permease